MQSHVDHEKGHVRGLGLQLLSKKYKSYCTLAVLTAAGEQLKSPYYRSRPSFFAQHLSLWALSRHLFERADSWRNEARSAKLTEVSRFGAEKRTNLEPAKRRH